MSTLLERARAARYLQGIEMRKIVEAGKADDVIRVAALFEAWSTGRAYEAGDTVLWEGQPMTCLTAHSTEVHPDWTPETAPSLWRAWHGCSVDTALPWVQPTGAHDAYMTGEYMIWSGGLWLCRVDGTVHTPGELETAWEAVEAGEAEEEPGGDEAAAWVQPAGGHDAYKAGDRVTHGGKTWVSAVDGNVWEPGVYGWEEVTAT